MPSLVTLLLIFGDGNGRASTKGLIAVIIIACYICWYLFRAGRYLYRKLSVRRGKPSGLANDFEIESEAIFFSDQEKEERLQRLFPGGEEELAKEANRLQSLLMGTYPSSYLQNVLGSASTFFALSANKSKGKHIAYILDQGKPMMSDADAKVVYDFISTRAFRAAMGLSEGQIKPFNDIPTFHDLPNGEAEEEPSDEPSGEGPFGLSPENPIPVKGGSSNNFYLSQLRTWSGEPIAWERCGHTYGATSSRPLDVYRIYTQEGQELATVYLSPYHNEVSDIAPEGFRMLTEADLGFAASS